MTKLQKLLLITGCLWTAFICLLFVAKAASNQIMHGEFGADVPFFFIFWCVPLALMWWPSGVFKHIAAWFNKE